MDAFIRLSALAQLAGSGGDRWTAADAQAWTALQRTTDPDAAGQRIALFAALQAGLIAEKNKGAVASHDDEWRSVQVAARAGRVGEGILLMLVALGEGGFHRAAPGALGAAVESLNALGRNTQARRLAAEAALANGF